MKKLIVKPEEFGLEEQRKEAVKIEAKAADERKKIEDEKEKIELELIAVKEAEEKEAERLEEERQGELKKGDTEKLIDFCDALRDIYGKEYNMKSDTYKQLHEKYKRSVMEIIDDICATGLDF